MWDVFCQTVRHEGYLALYRGIVPNLLKAVSYFSFLHRLFFQSIRLFFPLSMSLFIFQVPAVSITWAVYESSKQHLHAWADDP